MNEYSRSYEIRFSDIDANRHVNHAVYVEGVVLDLTTRKSASPGPELLQVFNAIPRTAGFEILPELLRRK